LEKDEPAKIAEATVETENVEMNNSASPETEHTTPETTESSEKTEKSEE
jgi:hypothetical protein